MASPRIRNWTFYSIAGAFFDLALAYFLLWVATVAFFTFKFLSLVGLQIPYPSFVDLPLERVSSLLNVLKNTFPFDSMFPDSEFMKGNNIEGSSSSPALPRRRLRRRVHDSGKEQSLSVFSSGSRLSFSENAESFYTPREQIGDDGSSHILCE